MRKPWNRDVRIYDSVTAGSGLIVGNLPARIVLRDMSAGLHFSPPFFAWMTCPIEQTLRGCQSSNLGAFVANDGMEVWSNDGIDYIGTILWCETWLPASLTNYQRVYLFDHTPGHGPGGGGGSLSPGATCAASTTIPFDTDVYWTPLTSADDDWWQFPCTAGHTYTVWYTPDAMDAPNCTVWTGDCGGLSSIITGASPFSTSFPVLADRTGRFEVQSSGMGMCPYTIRVHEA